VKEGSLVDVSEPHLEAVCEDGEDKGVKEGPPPGEGETADRIAKDAKAENGAVGAVGERLSVDIPAQLGGKENPQIAKGGCRADKEGFSPRVGDGEGGRGNALMWGAAARWMEEHELYFISIWEEAERVEPVKDERGSASEVGCCGGISGA